MKQGNWKTHLQYVVDFTTLYRSHSDIYLREAACLKMQTPYILAPIVEGDLIAGRMDHGFVGFSPQFGGLYTYYFNKDQLDYALEQEKDDLDPAFLAQIAQCADFWETEGTLNRLWNRFRQKFPHSTIGTSYTEPGVANTDGRLAGTNVDLDKLVRLGVPGLRAEIEAAIAQNGDSSFYQALLLANETIADACSCYEQQALELAKTAAEPWRSDLLRMADALHHNQRRAPASFIEGLQLLWVYAMISDLMNYGRLDVTLGDLYVQDLERGYLDEEEAIRLLTSLYTHFLRVHKIHDTRVIIGGRGRRNEANADRLAMVIMETSRRFKEVVPQLTMRYYKGMAEEVYDKALAVNAEGTTFPIIYSDDTNIPAVMKAYDISEAEAERYLPFGCGEYVLEGLSLGTPNCGVNVLKALELTLQRGYDHHFGVQAGIDTGDPAGFDTFEKLWDAYQAQLQPWLTWVAYHNKMNYEVAAEQAGYLHISLLMDDCIARGKDILNGGVRYPNASAEVFGIISCADSFTAIKKLVYDDKAFTLPQLAQLLRTNFTGHEKERLLFKEAPKYGNDLAYADHIAVMVFHQVAQKIIDLGKEVGFHKYLIVSVNNSMSAEWGTYCIASPCGRLHGDPMSNGNGASIGADQNGVTALLNSMAKIDPSMHVGVIHNVRFTKEMMKSSYLKVKEALRAFYENNGVQTNLSVIGRDDLENAMKNPEKYQNLIVRIGGFSARFVELNPVVQHEILNRTTYDS